MRIAHVTATYPPYPGGAGNTSQRFAGEQAARGHEVEIFSAPYGHPPGSTIEGGVMVHRIRPRFAIGNAPLIPSLARIDGFDVVHLMYPFIFGAELLLAGRATSRRRRAAALCVQYQNELVGPGWRGALFRGYEATVAPRVIAAADRVLALSFDHSDSVGYLRRLRSREPERIAEVPNGVDTELFSPGDPGDLRARLGIPGDAVLAAFVGTLDAAHRFKRVDVAIEAITRTTSPVHLAVAGGGELLEGFREKARTAGVAERVHLLGSVPHAELPGVLRAADAFVLTTEPPESFGIVVIEAMACGLPVIATDYPGVRAVIEDGHEGRVVPIGDAGAVARALDDLAGLPATERRAIGASGRRKATERWSWPKLTDRLDEVYAEAIERRRSL